MANSATFVEGATRTFTAGGALAKYTICMLSSGKLAAATDDESLAICVVESPAFADGDKVAGRLLSSEGTFLGIANAGETVAIGDRVAVVSGKLEVAAAGKSIALSAGGAGEYIEFLPLPILDNDAA